MRKFFDIIRLLGGRGGILLIIYKYFYSNLNTFKSTLEILEWTYTHKAKLKRQDKFLCLQGLPNSPNCELWFRPYTSDVFVIKQHFFGEELLPVVMYFKSIGCVPNQMIDAGGNIGMATSYMQIQFPELEVLLIEPSESNCLIAEKNIDPKRTVVWHNAVWWKEQSLYFDQKVPAWAIKVQDQKTSNQLLVQGVTLSGILQNSRFSNVDYIKIDIEGAEEEIFSKDTQLKNLLKKVRCISVEPHSKDFEVFFQQYLAEVDFRVIKSGELIIGFNRSIL